MVRLWPTSQNTFYFYLDLFMLIYLTCFHQEEKKTYTSKFSGENEWIQTKVKNKIFKFIYQKNRFEHVVSPLDRLRICGKGAYARFIYRARAPRPLLGLNFNGSWTPQIHILRMPGQDLVKK